MARARRQPSSRRARIRQTGFRLPPLAVATALGFVLTTIFVFFAPNWDKLFPLAGLAIGVIVTRPLRGLLDWLGKRRWYPVVPVFLACVAAVLDTLDLEALREHRKWLGLLVGVAVGVLFTGSIVRALVSLSEASLVRRGIASLLFLAGALAGWAFWAVVKDDLDAELWKWVVLFSLALLVGIAVADVVGVFLQRTFFDNAPWEWAFVGGAVLILFVVPALNSLDKEEDERLEKRPVLPVGNGALAYVRVANGQASIVVSRAALRPLVITPVSADSPPSWSADGTKLAFVRGRPGSSHIWMLDTETDKLTRLTSRAAEYTDPVLSPDGSQVAFARGPARTADIYTLSVPPGTEPPRRLTKDRTSELEPTWSPDGEEIAFASNAAGQFDLYVMAADGGRRVRLAHAAQIAANEREPAWAPHGRGIAFVSRTGGRSDVYLVDGDGRGRVVNVTQKATADSHDPTWSPKGDVIAFTYDAGGRRAIYQMKLPRLRKKNPGPPVVLEQGPAPVFAPAWRPVPDPNVVEGAEEGEIEADVVAGEEVDPLVHRYAPLVRLHRGEEYWPMSAAAFIRISKLKWVGCEPKTFPVPVVTEQLGGGEIPGDTADAYEVVRMCAKRPGKLTVHDRTRPQAQDDEGFVLDPGKKAKPEGLPPTVLADDPSADPEDVRRFVDPRVAPVYYEHVVGRSITYWMFYGYSATKPAGDLGEHQGDWERITVCLDSRALPVGVVYHRHHFNRSRRWRLVPKFGTHPIVYSAQGSHASYSSPGKHPTFSTFDRREEGVIWATWRGLVDVLDQRWYGYGGSWGNPPGPDGPSRYKVGDEGC